MLFVAYRALEGTRVSDLAEQTRVTRPSADFLVEQLEAAGYVERCPTPSTAGSNWWLKHRADRFQQMYDTLLELRVITDTWR